MRDVLAFDTSMNRRFNIRPFAREADAYRLVERIAWPEGPVCAHCGNSMRIGQLQGLSTRPGTYKCYECRRPFNVKVGTLFANSNVPLHKWLQAILLICGVDESISSNQLHRILNVDLRTARYLLWRIKTVMDQGRDGTRITRIMTDGELNGPNEGGVRRTGIARRRA